MKQIHHHIVIESSIYQLSYELEKEWYIWDVLEI